MILSIIAAVYLWQANLVLPEFCFAQDLLESEQFEENQKNEKIIENQETAGDRADEISDCEDADQSYGFADKIIFSSKNFWESRAVPCSEKIGDWFSNLWNLSIKPGIENIGARAHNKWVQNIKPFLQNIIDKANNILGENIESRKTDLGAEIEKEEQEIQNESPYLYIIIEKYREAKQFIWGISPKTRENSE